MSGDLESALVCFFNCCAQFIACNVHVGLERSNTLICPVVHHLPRVISTSQGVHHRCKRTLAFQIWSGDMHLWSDHPSCVDQLLDFQIGVWSDTSRSTNRCHSIRQIQTRETASHVGIHGRRATHWKEHVVVHPDQTG